MHGDILHPVTGRRSLPGLPVVTAICFRCGESVEESVQASTTQLVQWLKKDYTMSDSEVALFLGAVLKYDITELVDPHFDVVAKVPKAALATLRK